MVTIPEEVLVAIEKTSPVCIATTDTAMPNIIYVGFLKAVDNTTIVVADNKMQKTRANLLANGSLAVVVLDKDTKKSYQLKGKVEYVDSGEKFAAVQQWVKDKRPDLTPKGGIYMTVTEIYSGAEKIA